MKKLNSHILGRLSDELHDKTIMWLNNTEHGMNQDLGYKTRLIHLADSVSRGYTRPAKAYAAMEADYFPVCLELRDSAYAHLL